MKKDDAGSRSFSDTLSLCFDAPGGIRVLDIFIFRDTLRKPLELHRRFEAPLPETLVLSSRGGDRIAAVIANSPAPFNLEVIECLDNLEQAEMYYMEEDPVHPLMSTVTAFCDHSLNVSLTPLLCRVNILTVNNLTGSPMRNPRLTLKGVNSHVQMLRTDGFRTVETVDSPSQLAHPSMMQCSLGGDIGETPVIPGAVLFCYPFDGEGPSPTRLLVTTETREWTFSVPALGRAGCADLILDLT